MFDCGRRAETFGLTHAEVGGRLGEHWNLPEAVVETIRHHHSAREGGRSGQAYWFLRQMRWPTAAWEASGGADPGLDPEVADFLGLTEEHRAAVIEELRENAPKIEAMVSTLKSSAA